MDALSQRMPTVLVVDDEPEIQNVVGRYLSRWSYDPILASNGREALGKLKIQKPDIVLLDINMPDMDGFTVCRKMREDPATRLTPVLMLTTRDKTADKVAGLNLGADDYLPKPFELQELQARIDVLLRRTRNMIAVNPLTRLPGGSSIQEEISRRIRSGKKFGAAYIDIDNFKAYNDAYGFHQGDLVLVWTARLIQDCLQGAGEEEAAQSYSFLGHIGGDDFMVVADLERIGEICRAVAGRFDRGRAAWYNLFDRLRGHIQAKDRRGNAQEFPFMSLSVAISTNEKREIVHYGQVAQITAELKRFAKSRSDQGKSFVVFDRRSG